MATKAGGRKPEAMKLADAPDVLTVPQFAAVMCMGRRQAYEAIRRGDVYAVRIGRSWRIPKAEVLRRLSGGARP